MSQTRVQVLADTTDSQGNRYYEGDILYLDDAVVADLDTDVAVPTTEADVAIPSSFSFTAAAGSANVCEVTVQALDATGTAISGIFTFVLWLSDAASGAGLTGTTASGTVAVKSSSYGTDMGTLTTKKSLQVQTKSDGTYTLSITDSSKTHYYVCAQVPGTGRTVVSSQLTTANYG